MMSDPASEREIDQTAPAVRGCGRRVKGAVYITQDAPSGEATLTDYLLCPPIPMDAEGLGLSPRGVSLIRDELGVTHIVDWIGDAFYPNVADFLEEARRIGISRRIPRTVDFGRLSATSRLILIHHKGIIVNAAAYREAIAEESAAGCASWAKPLKPIRDCPRHNRKHMALRFLGGGEYISDMCQFLYYEDIEGGEAIYDPAVPYRTVARRVGETRYRARRTPDGVKAVYALAAFASIPIAAIAVIDDPDGDVTRTVERVGAAKAVRVRVVSQ